MTFEAIGAFVQSFGLPLAMAIIFFWLYYKLQQEDRKNYEAREEKLMAQYNEAIQQLNNFTIIMDKFNDTLTRIDERLTKIETKID